VRSLGSRERCDYDIRLGRAARVFAAGAAVRVCLSMMEVFGRLAIMYNDDSPVEKCLRDCISFLHWAVHRTRTASASTT